ncbi:SDR family NAD(P)-dependent oxidoreductase [Paenibacillus amylolyticus]|uniref:SDR family NAD(P)-dependent oxidoreductase n=1 Tax=Paenibacillus amylolyticus TaxID=1451 RepID=UPI003EBF5A87
MAETNVSSKIAIIGMACRFPGADNVEEYWNNLINGKESISFLTQQELKQGNVETGLMKDPAYVAAGSFIDGIECFDNEFFNYTLKEASVIDPQHRLFLECSWHALEDACIKPGAADRIGVFAGSHMNSYLFHVLTNPEVAELVGDLNVELGNEKDYLATRVSYKMDLRGPSMNIQTACSSSLVAVHMAVQSLLNGECDIALAGGVTINDLEKKGYLYQPGGIKSPDGHCRTFDKDAEGTIFGNGLGIVVLKRLEDARDDGNQIYASIIGTAVNNDGADKVGLAAPGFSGQRDVIEEAILMAGITPHDLSYIECHGTATRLGDSIEVSALKDVFSGYPGKGERCGLGSVKTNLGHLNKASGIAGLIKTVLAVKNKVIPPTLHFKEANPLLELQHSPFYIVDKLTDLSKQNKVMRAGVSSFGVGGTNAHVILEEAETSKGEDSPPKLYLLPYSGKSKAALERVEQNMYGLVSSRGENNIRDIENSLQRGRVFFPYRKFMVVDRAMTIKLSADDVQTELHVDGDGEFQYATGGVLFAGMMDGACEHLKDLLGSDAYLKKLMEPLLNEARRMTGFDVSQPDHRNMSIEVADAVASFILQAAVARLLEDFSVKPEFIAGINSGELAAACSAGIMSWKDGLLLLLVRGKVIDSSALASCKLSSTHGRLILGRDGGSRNSSTSLLNIDYWLQEDADGTSEEDFAKNYCHTGTSSEETLLIRIGMKKEKLKDVNGDEIKIIDAIELIDHRISLLPLIGKLWVNRLASGFDAYSQSHPARFVSLPAYPFEKAKCWLDLHDEVFQGRPEAPSTEDFLYAPSWQQVREKAATPTTPDKCWLFLMNEERWTEAIKQEVRKAGHTVISMDNAEEEQDWQNTFTRLKNTGVSPDYIVYSLVSEPSGMNASLFTRLKADFYALLRMTCAFEAVFNQEVKILILSNNVYSVLGEKADNFFASVFQGACTVVPQEFPKISCLAVDVDSNEYDGSAEFFRKIINKVLQARGGELLVYRRGYFWRRSYEKIDDFTEVAKEPLAIEPDGVYVITGGTGGLGLEVIEYLINRINPKIAVISRNPAGGQRIDELRTRAAELKLFQADVTDAEALEQVFRDIRSTMGEIRGVFHLAGLPGKGLILNKTMEELQAVMGPKLEGTLLLDSIVKPYHPDFIILFSSMIALKGGNGQVDYCGANHFLDNYALYNTQRGTRVVSINWDAWHNVGMTADSMGSGQGLTQQQAAECLDYILRSLDNPRVVVSMNDVNKLITCTTKPSARESGQGKPRSAEDISYEFVVQKLEGLFTLIAEVDEIDPNATLDDLGIDSVLILQLLNEIDRVFPGIFSISKFYIYPTLHAMADYIFNELTISLAKKDKISEPNENGITDFMKKVKNDDISIEEAVNYLLKGETDDE